MTLQTTIKPGEIHAREKRIDGNRRSHGELLPTIVLLLNSFRRLLTVAACSYPQRYKRAKFPSLTGSIRRPDPHQET